MLGSSTHSIRSNSLSKLAAYFVINCPVDCLLWRAVGYIFQHNFPCQKVIEMTGCVHLVSKHFSDTISSWNMNNIRINGHMWLSMFWHITRNFLKEHTHCMQLAILFWPLLTYVKTPKPKRSTLDEPSRVRLQ